MYSELFIREAVEKVLLLCKRVFVRFPRRGGGWNRFAKGWLANVTAQ